MRAPRERFNFNYRIPEEVEGKPEGDLEFFTNTAKNPLNPEAILYQIMAKDYPEFGLRLGEKGYDVKGKPLAEYISVWFEKTANKGRILSGLENIWKDPRFSVLNALQRKGRSALPKIQEMIKTFQESGQLSSKEAERLLGGEPYSPEEIEALARELLEREFARTPAAT